MIGSECSEAGLRLDRTGFPYPYYLDKMGDVHGIPYFRTADKSPRDFNIGIWYDGETGKDADWIMGYAREYKTEDNRKGKF